MYFILKYELKRKNTEVTPKNKTRITCTCLPITKAVEKILLKISKNIYTHILLFRKWLCLTVTGSWSRSFCCLGWNILDGFFSICFTEQVLWHDYFLKSMILFRRLLQTRFWTWFARWWGSANLLFWSIFSESCMKMKQIRSGEGHVPVASWTGQCK